MRPIGRLLTTGLCLAAGLGSTSLPAQSLASGSPHPGSTPAVLDVPYLPQSVLLCGGAALAMVERWWGRRGVYAQEFAALVRPDEGGIRTTDLAAAARTRGWDARVLTGTSEVVQATLRDGVPVIALIQVGRARYHYVVLVRWSDDHVVFHDPAGAPFTTTTEARFLTRWTGAHRWALAVRPEPAAAATQPVTRPDPAPAEVIPCPPWLDQALDTAAAGQLDEAAQLLRAAGRACPAEPLVTRELAGIRFKQRRYAEAIQLAREYVALAPEDGLGWQLLASSRYLTGDLDGALEAWNRIDRPTVDLLRIDGTRKIRFRTLAAAISVPHGTVLSPSRLALARRRLAEIPALRGSGVEYRAVQGGLVEVRAAVDERPTVGPAWRLALTGVVRALAQHEVGLDVATPTGAGELLSASWRWESARQRAVFRLDMPADLGFPGVVRLESGWERFRFTLDRANLTTHEETRRSTVVGFGGWVAAGVRPSAALRLDRWSADRSYLAISLGAELHARGDRLTLTATSERAVALNSHPSYTRAAAGGSWASGLGLGRPAWSARLGADWASPDAPLGTWPIAGSNLAWAIPLRAHPAASGGLLAGRNAGRAIIHGGIAGDHPVSRLGPLVVAAGLFLDGAEVIGPADQTVGDRFYLDGGAGLRFGLADGQLGVLRIDLATGLTDRRSALSIGVQRRWPLGR